MTDEVTTGTRLGRYVLGDRLAAGGMGEVYLAVQEGLGQFQKPLALKLLLPHLMERSDAVQMFLEEARLAARMSHPNVVQIFDVGVEQGRYYIAMELVRGVSLATLIRVLAAEGRRPSAATLSYVGRALLEALDHAHGQTGADGEWLGLVHRDVTPHNVMVSVHGEVKLTDFGIAKARGKGAAERDRALVGKAGYFAPEQISEGRADRRTDLFSAALTLYELATLEPAFRRETDEASLHALKFEPPPDLRVLRPELPREFATALERASSKDPGQRFPSARGFREAWPNLATPDTAAQLGEEVARSCRGAIAQLDGKTRSVAAQYLGTGTPDLALPPATRSDAVGSVASPADDAPRGRRRYGALAFVGGALAVLAVGVGYGAARHGSTAAVPHADLAVTAPVVPEPKTTPPPPTPPDPSPRPSLASSHSRALRVAASKVGFLSVDSTPWAQVRVNGKLIGETPIARFPLAEGRAKVVLLNPSSGKQATRVVNVQAGQLSSFRETLR